METLMLPPHAASEREQTRWQGAKFFGKAWFFRIRRCFKNFSPPQPKRFKKTARLLGTLVIAESRGLLYTSNSAAEFALQAGKVHNLRIAASYLDGLLIPARQVFSFWAHVPRPSRWTRFAAGRELREGCIVPSIGGGLCQLSNALYDAALLAQCEIVERHAHSRKLPGSMAAFGRDATVFWNYVDLRFRHVSALRLEVHLTGKELIVRLREAMPQGAAQPMQEPIDSPAIARFLVQESGDREPVESCETCNVTSCFRHIERTGKEGLIAWLTDSYWPEFDAYILKTRRRDDWLYLPLDSNRFHLGNYRWNTKGFAGVRQAPWEVMRRSWLSRHLAGQGAERQRALLGMDEMIAARFGRSLPASATHLVVSQNLLPFLWQSGALGGRTFDVLMTRLPLWALQNTLDLAASQWPESATLADFRADPGFVESERAALEEARHWITPHSAIAKLGGERSLLLDWDLPQMEQAKVDGGRILYPASTLGRKGAYELREAARSLDLPLLLGGRLIEDEHFWKGVDVELVDGNSLEGVRAVVLPAWVENQPRRLLRAISKRVPVIASEACGLRGLPGVIEIPEGCVKSLTTALSGVLADHPSLAREQSSPVCD